MDIGTGTPSVADLEMLPHHVINCLDPSDKISAYQYLILAAKAFHNLYEADYEVWVCGGTGLYIRALLAGLALGEPPRPRLRDALGGILEVRGTAAVARELGLDVRDENNPVRVIRAAETACGDGQRCREVYSYCGLTDADIDADQQVEADTQAFVDAQAELARWKCSGLAVLDPGKEQLTSLVQRRVDGMFSAGLVDETAALRQGGYGGEPVVADGIGYREALAVLDGALAMDEAVKRVVIRTRQYAKRQRTYFRGMGWPVFKTCGECVDYCVGV